MTEFSQELFDDICNRIADGESLRKICREGKMPVTSTVMKWVANDTDLAEQYARAREASADADADDIKDIAERTLTGEYESQAARLAIDALKWSAGKRQPKKYGDKVQQELSGPDGGEIPLSLSVKFERP